MDDFANPGLLNLQAQYIDPSDSHARPGCHVRLAHHPLLGLPIMPFVLERAEVNPTEFERLKFRTDAVWHDRTGRQRFPPFSIGDEDEITVTMPTGTGAMAIWAQIVADPGSPRQPDITAVVPDRPTGSIPRPPGSFDARFLDRSIMRTDALTGFFGTDLGLRATTGAMRVEGFLKSAASGTRSLGTRSEPPFAFSGPGLAKFIVRGRGTVAGIRWLAGDQTQKGLKWEMHEVLNLPHKGGVRYLSLTNWESLCEDRVDRQSPKRRPLQDVTGATSRTAAPGHSPAEEFDRVNTLFAGLETPLDELIDGATPQHRHVTRHALTRAGGNPILADGSAAATIPTLGLMMQAPTDPGVASWMGYKSHDGTRVEEPEHRLTFYRLRGYFDDPANDVVKEGGLLFALLMQAARQTSGVLPLAEMFQNFSDVAKAWLARRQVEASPDMAPMPGLILCAVAVADSLAPLDAMRPPVLDTPRHVTWLPGPVSAPVRAMETDVRDIPAGGAMAVQMRQPQNAGAWRSLNRTVDEGAGAWRTLMLAGMVSRGDDAPPLPPGVAPPDTVIADSRTGPGTFSLHAALMDRFGRFSDWAVAPGAAGPRPKPPRPVLIGSYRPPAIASGSHIGRITVVVPLPEAETLAPGSFPLSLAAVSVRVAGAAFGAVRNLAVAGAVSIHPNNNIPDPDAPVGPGSLRPMLPVPAGQDRRGVKLTFDGPAIPATRSRSLNMTAHWEDVTGQISVESEPVDLTMTDPYPPAQIRIPDVLDYAARPDATGMAWVERDIPGLASGVTYAVYYADENRLRDHLRRSQAAPDATLLEQLEGEPDPAARATALRAAGARFPGHLFERLEGAVETNPTLRFRHALPGSLRVLSAYKVAVESAANAAGPDLSQLDTIFYGVPNSNPPPRPSVRVELVEPQEPEPALVAQVTVTLRAGLAPASVARLRRTRSGDIDPIRNPVVATEPFGPVDPVTGLQTALFRDIGAAQIAGTARLMPFVNYAWIAEAQGAEEPGSMSAASGLVPGLWGEASAPATLTLIPDAGPVAPIFATARSRSVPGGRTDIELAFDYPVDLTPGSPGPWRIRVERAAPDAGLVLLSEDPATGGMKFAVTDGDVVPARTRFRVRVIDPVGRESPPVEHQF